MSEKIMNVGCDTSQNVHSCLKNQENLRVAVLWNQWTGYMDAGLLALQTRTHASFLLVCHRPSSDAPFELTKLPAAAASECVFLDSGQDKIEAAVQNLEPHLILMCSWDNPLYRRLTRRWKGRAVRVMQMDNQWLGTLKQHVGVAFSPAFVQPLADYAFVPGERQAKFARLLGFSPNRILRGSLSADTKRFSAIDAMEKGDRRAFICMARLVESKGIPTLLKAYRSYREAADDPWPLIVCGTGPLVDDVASEPGVDYRGFVQPSDLPATMAEAGCLVLASTFEPYGVVIHEAAAAGLCLICSDACGAADHFIDPDGANGVVHRPGDHEALALAMRRIASYSPEQALRARRKSLELAATISPEGWARALLGAVEGKWAAVEPETAFSEAAPNAP